MRKLILAAALVVCFPLSGIPRAFPGETEVDYTPQISELRRFLNEEMERLEIPCLSIALVDGQKIIWQEGFGFQDPEKKIPATEKTVYRVGSISKLFTAVAVLQLQEKKLLDLDAPITARAPELIFRNPYNPDTPITLRHLLSHRSGILRESPLGNYFDDTEPDIATTVRSIIGSELIFPVGERTKYSNLGPTVAGYLMEKVTGTPFAAYMDENILKPLGMTSSSFLPDREVIRKNLARAFMVDFDGRYFPAPTFSLGTLPAGNLYSTVEDLSRFLIMLFREGRVDGKQIIRKETLQEMFSIQFARGDPVSGFGLGFYINQLEGRKTISHNGAVYGFASGFAGLPGEKIGVVVLNNVDCANGFNEKVIRKSLGLLLNRKAGTAIPPLPQPIRMSPGELAEYSGKYRAGELDAWASVKEGALHLELRGVPQILAPLDKDRFLGDSRLAYGLRVNFQRDASGEVSGMKAGTVEYKKIPGYRPTTGDPGEYAKFLGRYGWPHNIMKIYLRDGKLTCRIEWFYEYPLKRVDDLTFSFPGYGLYLNEKIRFVPDGEGKITEARMGTVRFKKLPPKKKITSFISPDDHWVIWTALIAVAALSIYLEQKNRIARKLTGPVIALFGGMALSNLWILPSESDSYGIIGDYLVPLVIPLFLMKTNILRLIRETGRLFTVFHFSALGTVFGAFVAVLLLGHLIPHLPELGAAMTASYIGGSVNFVAMIEAFHPPRELASATMVADNGIMAIYFLILIILPGLPLVRKIFPKTEIGESFYGDDGDGGAESYWKPKPISLLHIATSVSLAFLLALFSVKVSGYFSASDLPGWLKGILGQKYLILTTVSVAFPLIFPRISNSLAGSEELGTFLIYIFFVGIGIPASFESVILKAPLVFLFCAIILFWNFVITFGLGKLFRYELEEMILCAVVTSGGPMNGAAIAVSKGWTKLVFPSVLAGIWGYVIGNYLGIITGNALEALFPS